MLEPMHEPPFFFRILLDLDQDYFPQIYSFPQLLICGHAMDSSIFQFSAILQKNLEANHTSFKTPKIEFLE